MNAKSDERALTYLVPEAGALLGLSRAAAYSAAKRGEIPVIRIGKLLRVPRAALHRMLEEAGSTGGAPRPRMDFARGQPEGGRCLRSAQE